ncbi:hypothetical protein BDA99DRAFT_496467 [Phascolomyces articulosus]|uniref:Uncharacterized protein n=1 Tax=Phascolomyces articulosus TaxID=60185 RepID=A0AAD5K9W5_9FUNG|nr:hypothetical protein BDA99DRAFT_496467 [Phascolomyces articulosus]
MDLIGQLLYRVALQYLNAIENSASTTSKGDNSLIASDGAFDSALTAVKTIISGFWTTSTDNDDVNIKGDSKGKLTTSKVPPSIENDERLRIATTMLEKAGITYGNDDALFLLAEINFYAKYTHPRNYPAAFEYYSELASVGNATAQQMVGFMYATGVGNVVERDQAQALLYHTFAAHGGDTAAEMTLGYRHLLGIGTEQKCEDAIYYYQRVAEKAINYYLAGPPGGYAPPLPKIRLSDEVGGVYGYGASVMTDKRYRPNSATSERTVSIEEVLQYWRYLAQTKGDFEAQLMLGQIYYQGTRSIPQDFKEAYYFFEQVIDKLPSGKITEAFLNNKRGRAIGQAAGYLGKMYRRGEGVEVDPERAYKWFYLGSELNDSNSQNGLGMMHLEGLVVPKSRDKAIEYFKSAVNQDNPDAQVNLAIEYVNQENTLPNAIRLFALAAEAKHPLAQWYLAQLYQAGIGLNPSCQVAVSFYKSIAERCDWHNPTVETAYNKYMDSDTESALLHYMLAAERGYEIAQSNVAYILDTDTQLLSMKNIFGLSEEPPRDQNAEQCALIYWSRSANQNNVDSRVKMGDYYFRGIGTEVDYEKAAACYQIAAEIELSPMAMWNLGWMYENGLGVTKDFHLAKRFYDNALSMNPDAYLPVKLSLAKLYLRYYWGWITRTEVGQDLMHENKATSGNSRNDGQGKGSGDHTVDGSREQHVDKAAATAAKAAQEARRRQEIEAYEYERAHWEISSEEELRRKYSKHLKRLEREESDDFMDPNFGRSDYSDDDDDDEYSEEDELIESLMILGLCLLVGWLVYMRQFRFGNNNNNNIINNNNAETPAGQRHPQSPVPPPPAAASAEPPNHDPSQPIPHNNHSNQ